MGQVTRQDILRVARSYLGCRWKHQGRSRWALDCAGLIILVAHELGLFDCTTRVYPRAADGVTLRACCEEFLEALPGVADVQPGDVLSFDDGGRYPCHLAIVGDGAAPCSLIHATPQARRVVEQRADETWLARVRAAYRFRGIPGWGAKAPN